MALSCLGQSPAIIDESCLFGQSSGRNNMCISRLLIAYAEARLSLPPLRGKPWVNRHEKTRSWIGADRPSEARYAAVIATPRALRQISASGNACDDYGLEVRFESKSVVRSRTPRCQRLHMQQGRNGLIQIPCTRLTKFSDRSSFVPVECNVGENCRSQGGPA